MKSPAQMLGYYKEPERYDVHLSAEDEANRAVFATLKSLTDYVAAETA